MVRDKKKVNSSSLALQRKKSDQDEKNAEEQTAEDAMDTTEDQEDEEHEEDEEDEEDDYDLYRLERLLRLDESNKLPSLNPQHVFEKAVIDRSVLPIGGCK